MKNTQHTIENQETHYIHAKKISSKQETPHEIKETHHKFQETIIMSKKILQIPRKHIYKSKKIKLENTSWLSYLL